MAITDSRVFVCICALLALLLFGQTAMGASRRVNRPDVRVLIDVSGSMKQNDPHNLRRPALRLLVGLLPEDSRAGVWTFGRYVNMQVPLGKVDAGWKARARQGASEIHSYGLYTNIEEALKRSIEDWLGASTRYQRHLILLTDGMVDISKDRTKSSVSRQRIIDQLLPRLKGLGARVHTIALSQKSDQELLRLLATATGGWYEQVDNAEQLQRIFLRLFEKVGQPDTLPLKDNRFVVDESIKEVTLLVFHQAGAAPTRIVPPGGGGFDAGSAPRGVAWHRDEGYDLLTITKPKPGEWRIEAAVDPDNRVMVVTHLKMKTTDIPNRVLLGEQIPLQVQFTDKDRPITEKAFLNLVEVKMQQVDANGPGEPRPIYDDGKEGDEKAADGVFSTRIGEGLAAGKVELIIRAEGKTFQRERRQFFELAAPATLELVEQEQAGRPGILVKVTPNMDLLQAEGLSFTASLSSSEGEERPVMLLPGVDGVAQESWIDPSALAGNWTLNVTVSGKMKSGQPLEVALEPVTIQGKLAAPSAPVEPPKPQPEVAPEPEAQDPPMEDWMKTSLVFGGVNLFLLVVGGLAFWLIRRRRGDDLVQLVKDEPEKGEAHG